MKPFSLFFEQEESSVAILPGGFKPPTKGHFKALQYILNDAKRGVVFVGKKDRDGITADMSAYIWEIYSKYLSKPIEVVVSEKSPVLSTIEYVDKHLNSRVIVGAGDKDEDIDRYKYFIKNIEKYPLVQIVKIPKQEGGISGTMTRELISTDIDKALDYFLPEEVKSNINDRAQIKNILRDK
jgi:phosphopantetheine adenylyltransferase